PLFEINEYQALIFLNNYFMSREQQIESSDTFQDSFPPTAVRAVYYQNPPRLTFQNKSKTKIYPIALCQKSDIINRNLNRLFVNSMKGKTDKKITKAKLPEESKKFLEYDQSKPFQLSLFDLLENEKEFSHTIE